MENSDARPGQGGKTDPFAVEKGNEDISYVDAGVLAPPIVTLNPNSL